MKRRLLTMAVTTVLATALAGFGGAFAAKPAGVGGGKPGGGGGGGETTLGNNLSVPTVFAPAVGASGVPALRVSCPGGYQKPTGDPVSIAGGSYYLQKTASTWSADCVNATTAFPDATKIKVQANWGDNLTGGGRLSAGKPIRIEMLLHEFANLDAGSLVGTGFTVLKLTEEIDRLATYGTDGVPLGNQSFIVFDSGARLKIDKCTGPTDTVCSAGSIYDGAISAEINSTGKIVYGFNWGVGTTSTPSPGTYKVTWVANNTTVVSAADGSVCADASCAYVIVTLSSKGGGGGKPPGAGEGE
jgi:hypothetical protein